jgi:2-isopropylmalate synthase
MSAADPHFSVCQYKVVSERVHEEPSRAKAFVEVEVGNSRIKRGASGVGPVHALDGALRECLRSEFPELDVVRLSDYRVSVVNAGAGTAAQVRVIIEATDGRSCWVAGCVSDNIVDASFEALCSTAIMGIMRARSRPGLVDPASRPA